MAGTKCGDLHAMDLYSIFSVSSNMSFATAALLPQALDRRPFWRSMTTFVSPGFDVVQVVGDDHLQRDGVKPRLGALDQLRLADSVLGLERYQFDLPLADCLQHFRHRLHVERQFLLPRRDLPRLGLRRVVRQCCGDQDDLVIDIIYHLQQAVDRREPADRQECRQRHGASPHPQLHLSLHADRRRGPARRPSPPSPGW